MSGKGRGDSLRTPRPASRVPRPWLARDERLCERYRDLLKDNFEALLLRRLRVVWYGYRASRRRNLYRGVRRFQLAVLACLDALIPWDECLCDDEARLQKAKVLQPWLKKD